MSPRHLLDRFDHLASWLQSPLLLVLRLYWGWSFFLTGKGKLLNLDRTTDFFTELHLPLPKLNAIMAGSTECFGGLLLLLGLFARPVAVPLTFTMIVAYATADREAQLELRLVLVEKRLRAQYTALDTNMGRMQGLSSYLTQQLSKL